MTGTRSAKTKISTQTTKKEKTSIILFEGVDGAGKTYLLNEIKKRLTQKNYTVLTLSNPYGQAKLSWSGRLHSLIVKEKFCPLTQALLYIGIIMENQKIYVDKKYDYVLIDRYIHSALAYNIFYPALLKNMAPPLQDPQNIARLLSKVFCSSVRCSNNLPCQTFLIKAAPETFNLQGFNFDILEKAYEETEKAVEKIYRNFGARYNQETIFNNRGNTDAINDILEKIYALSRYRDHSPKNK